MTEAPMKPKSDLGVRAMSAVVMVAVAGTALLIGGWLFTAMVVLVGLGVLYEWFGLTRRIARTSVGLGFWLLTGTVYIGLAAFALMQLRQVDPLLALFPILLVIGVDVGAYFAGRTFGGPKIAPSISPSKTWSGLLGGVGGAAVAVLLCYSQLNRLYWIGEPSYPDRDFPLLMLPTLQTTGVAILLGSMVAIIAQSGDFFESWMKRRAGVKDSGTLIPGHGGLFDRTDGLIAVLFVFGAFALLAFK